MKILKDAIKRIFKIKFIQDVGSLQISTIIIAGITMITSLIIAKGLGPTDFGIYNLVFSLCGLVGMFGNLGTKQMVLIKLPSAYINQDKKKTISVIAFYFKTALIIAVLIMTIGYIIAPYLSQLLYNRQDIGRLSRILFLMPPLIILYKLVGVILEGTRNMKYLAITECASTLLKAFILITVVILGLGLTVLIYSWLFYAMISSILAIFIYKNAGLFEKELPHISEIVKKSYFVNDLRLLRFNLSTGLAENIINLNDNLPVILLGIFVLPKDVGYFKVGYSIMGLSLLFLEPVARNLLVKLKQLQAKLDIKGLSETFYRVSLFSGAISVLLTIGLIILYHFLTYFFLKGYKLPFDVIYLLGIYFCLMGFGIGLSPVLRALERLDIEIKTNATGILIFIVLSLVLIKNLGISGLTLALVISSLFTKFIMYISVKGQLNKLKAL